MSSGNNSMQHYPSERARERAQSGEEVIFGRPGHKPLPNSYSVFLANSERSG
jgi:hypothetical protein